MTAAAPQTTHLTTADLEWAAVVLNEQMHTVDPAGNLHCGFTTALTAVREMLVVAERVETERTAHAARTHAWVLAQADTCECGHERRRHQVTCQASIGHPGPVTPCPCHTFRKES